MIGKKVSLRALEPHDVDLLYIWENSQETWKISNTLTPFSRFVLEQYVMNADQDIFSIKQLRLMIDLIEDVPSPRTIGSIELFDFSPAHRRAGVGILIEKEYRQQGYASEALDLLIEYAFNTLNLHQVYCNISDDNMVSLKLFRSKGFVEIGVKKDWSLANGKWINEYFLQLVKQ